MSTDKTEEQNKVAEKHLIYFKVDDEPFTTDKSTITPTDLMVEFAKVDPALNYVIQLRGKSDQSISYEGKPMESIHLHEGISFVTIYTGPTQVS